MKEKLDIRCHEDWAQRAFGDSLGEPMQEMPPDILETLSPELQERLKPSTRQILLNADDPMFPVLKERILKVESRSPYHSECTAVLVSREYTRRELAEAELLQFQILEMFEPCGQDLGTVYDATHACPNCGFGRIQKSPLLLDLNEVPNHVDVAVTIARDEWIVSERLADLIRRHRVTGCQLEQVEHRGRRRSEKSWFQLIVTGQAGSAVPPTRFGQDYIRDWSDEEYECVEHGLSGLNLISEVYLNRRCIEPVDVSVTFNRKGYWSGFMMPTPVIIITPRFYQLLQTNNIKGYGIEVAHALD